MKGFQKRYFLTADIVQLQQQEATMFQKILAGIGDRYAKLTTEKAQLRAELKRATEEIADLKIQNLRLALLLKNEVQMGRTPSSPQQEPQENPCDGIPYLAKPKGQS